jgi:two-component system, OmpR family, sensor histidine kinase KdpD
MDKLLVLNYNPFMRYIWKFLAKERYVLPFLFSIVSTGIVTALLFTVREHLHTATIVLLYLLPVGASAALWGLWPGIVAALMAFFSLNYFFLSPYGTLMVHQSQDIVALVVFLVLATSISQLVGRMTNSLSTARARENETTRLYELSLALSKLHREPDILSTLAQHTLETFQAEQVEIFAEGDPQPSLIRLPDPPNPGRVLPERPTIFVSIQGSQRLLGEIRLWRINRPLNPAEERLLHTFASQSALTLERARLTASESRARILEESDRMKSSLLSSVSHELRTPLATIKAAVTSLRSEDVTWEAEARRDLLAAVEEETDHLNQLVGNLLNMSRIEAGALQLKRRWNVLAEIAAGAVKRARLTGQGHRIEVDIPDEFPLVYVDDVLMEQVFNNLLSNSLKYSPANSVIQIMARQQDEQTIWVQVNNQGPAVSETDLEKIFDKFHRVTAADQITGTGLGLSICKGLVEAHQEHIWAENLEQGFTIRFTLPIHVGGAAPRIPSE